MRDAVLVFVVALASIGCGGSVEGSPQDPSQVVRTPATSIDVERTLARFAAANACTFLLKRSLPISGDPAPPGADAGLQPAKGRWWIQRCEAQQLGDRLVVLHLEGPGWVWVNQVGGVAAHYGVTQYVPFFAQGTTGGTFDLLSYDGRGDIASVTFHPVGRALYGAGAGAISPYPENGLAVVGSVLTGGGLDAYAVTQAMAQANKQLNDSFKARLSSDATITLNLRTGDVDFIGQPLVSGVVPKRPFDDLPLADREHELAVESQQLDPIWPQIIGPLEPVTNAAIDFRVFGSMTRYETICARDLEPLMAPAFQGLSPLPNIERAKPMMYAQAFTTVGVSEPCRWYLVTASNVESMQSLRIRGATWAGPLTQ